ncbi:putative toxin-antitoxin system toxin component, PIN family [Spirosoma rhododendri]|uniref:Putative toxin-antitoxin system toxin component, PIN family n=1 Tax=Spirosoma rhododendri TaxID=2728024 RepID=A0A7L5DHG7_9BACT|nr:putative toxin-antitoxin system toxin component, PIN family [Spirosoma rhododendri]QJD77784.1 putative toxin-antitoxin system toxin component, PIN family [Spirosoma rhododendri]
MRIVLDTNCLLAILPKVSAYRPVFDAYRSERFELAVSTSILAEYEEILSARTTPAIARNVLELINRQPNTILSTVYYQWGIITTDYDDNKFVDCALAVSANYIVTNDRHFNQIREHDFPVIACLRLDAFMALLPWITLHQPLFHKQTLLSFADVARIVCC